MEVKTGAVYRDENSPSDPVLIKRKGGLDNIRKLMVLAV